MKHFLLAMVLVACLNAGAVSNPATDVLPPARAIVAETLALEAAAKNRVITVEIDRIRTRLVKANRAFREEAMALSKKFSSIIKSTTLTWGNNGAKSKRGALTELLEQYKNALTNFSTEVDVVVTSEHKRGFGGREPIVQLLADALSSMRIDHEALMAKLASIKQELTVAWTKEINDLVWSAQGMMPGAVTLESASISDRNRFVDLFVGNLKTFYSLHYNRLEELISTLVKLQKK